MSEQKLNGAQSLIQTLVNCDVDVCFGNPGTSEMHFVAALDSVPRMRGVLCLFEGVATGAADGYGRIAERPAATLLHLGPGLANGLANLHNARRASTPIVNVVGDHATYHLQYDALLTSDIVGFARPVSAWIHESKSSRTVGADAARAVQAAKGAPGSIATLILPANCAWEEADAPANALPDEVPFAVSEAALRRANEWLRNGKKTAILLGGATLRGIGLETAGKIQTSTGARLFCDTFAPHVELGAGRVKVERIPYFAEQITAVLQDVEQLILVGTRPPVSFFAYPGKPSWCAPESCAITYLSHAHEDAVIALSSLAESLGATAPGLQRSEKSLPGCPTGSLTPLTIAQAIAELTPENAIFADESCTSGAALHSMMATARPFTHLPLTGGSIGLGLPLAIGASIAAPDRKVVCPHGDGGAAYTMQALWTMAREKLDVTVVIYANRSYGILNIEMGRVGVTGSGAKALSMLDLHNPDMNWVRIAEGLGVEASRANTAEEFVSQYRSAMHQHGPRLIEAVI
ncbi:acetolactate synthase-1/2/3 large subunit [Ralstonia sp. 25mfcol4.1]|uniref:acetolactate synthase large subunit n=1 Tax=Ralstonia sp. 25mfcol4.1 TaxID=1761899 RepID=UPI0003F577A0|nr:acetolactate synthase large subunit [Ralstonia sp. 25mfcol4.1]SDP77554.1 acetolactate synthase-1/2/3 large subunit [Ralstonia sp. 25mfcol4.1]